MKQILGVIVHLIGYVLLLGMFAVALISIVFDKPVHPHGIEARDRSENGNNEKINICIAVRKM